MKRYIAAILLVMTCVSCERVDINEVLLMREDISLTARGNLKMAYDPLTYQIGYNKERNGFRLYDDNIGNWMEISFNSMVPQEGHEVEADLKYTESSTIKSHNDINFIVKKRDSSGMIWLWNNTYDIGIVVKEFN